MYSLLREFRSAAQNDAEPAENCDAEDDDGERQLHRGNGQRRDRGKHQVGAAAIAVFKLDSYLVTAGRTVHIDLQCSNCNT